MLWGTYNRRQFWKKIIKQEEDMDLFKYSQFILLLLTALCTFQMQAGSLESMAICSTHQINWLDPA